MKKTVLASVLVALGMSAAFAGEMCNGKGECPCHDGPPPFARDGKGMDPAKFPEMKTKILAHIKEHQACVEAAQSPADLKACRPKRADRENPERRPPPGMDRPGPDRNGPPPGR